jgi:hypothetical protein
MTRESGAAPKRARESPKTIFPRDAGRMHADGARPPRWLVVVNGRINLRAWLKLLAQKLRVAY